MLTGPTHGAARRGATAREEGAREGRPLADATARTAAPTPSRLLVKGREYSLTLSRVRIDPGESIVQFVNAGEDPHDLVLKRVGGTRKFGAGETAPGDLAQFDARLRPFRRYVLYCSLADHRALGMKAHLTVRRRR